MIVFNEAKPKYEKLNELLENQLLDIRYGSQVNIILDVKELSKKFFRPDISVDERNRRNLITEISSDILNTIGHYRNFFYKHSKYTTFYFLYSFDRCKKFMDVYPDYKKEYYDKYFGTDPKVSVIEKALKAVEKITNKAIPHAYFIDTSLVDEYLYARYIKEELTKENELNIIISNDNMLLQLLDDHTFILAPKGIKSSLYTSENVMAELTKDPETSLTKSDIPLAFSLCGVKKYSLKNIPNVAITKALDTVIKLHSNGNLDETGFIDFLSLNDRIIIEKRIKDMQSEVALNYSIIRGDTIFHANKILISSSLISILNEVKAPGYFTELNSKIYPMYPLQIDMIIKGEKI